LQDLHCRSLIDHRTLTASFDSTFAEVARSRDRRQSLVGQSHRNRFDGPLQSFCECSGDAGGFTLLAAQRLWQSDDNLHGLVFGHDVDNPPDIRRVGSTFLGARHSLDRCRQNPVGVAGRNPDPDATDIDRDTSAAARVVNAGAIGTLHSRCHR
jgi:hypothetical protein